MHIALVAVSITLMGRTSAENKQAADALPQLDVTSVDLSFAEDEDEQAVPSIAQPAVAVSEPPPPPEPQTILPEPPSLTVPPMLDSVTIEKVKEMSLANVRSSDIRPRELEVPESQPEQRLEKPTAAAVAPQPQSAAVAPKQARVDAPPSPRRNIRPKYPDGARKRGEQGDVTLELEVDMHGVVVNMEVVGGCGFAELEQAAMVAVRKARFRPAKRDGKSVSSRARLTLSFRLRD